MAKDTTKDDDAIVPGTVNMYNKGKIVVKKKPYYYDRDVTDADIQKDFSDMMAGLKKVNMKLKDELNLENPVKLDIKK